MIKKKIMRISSQLFSVEVFVSSVFNTRILFSLSHTVGHLEFSWSSLGGV